MAFLGKPKGGLYRCSSSSESNIDGVVMRALVKVDRNGEQRVRVSDELRQLKLMSKGLRTKAMRALLERHASANPRLERKPVLPEKAAVA